MKNESRIRVLSNLVFRKIIKLLTNKNNRNILQNVFSLEQLIEKLRLEGLKQQSFSK